MASTTARRRGAAPDPGAVEALSAPRDATLAPAPRVDPVTRAAAGGATHGRQKKVGFWQPPERTDRLRAAYFRTRHLTGARSLTEFIDQAVMARVAELEAQHNGGAQFPPMGPGEIGTGKPMGL